MNEDLPAVVGHNVRRIRESRGLTQEALAEAIGVHRTYIGSLEVGTRNLTLRTLGQLATKLDVDPLELLGP